MARRKEPGREVTSTTEACPKIPKPPTGSPNKPSATRSPKWTQTQIIAIGLTTLTLLSAVTITNWWALYIPVQSDIILSSTTIGGDGEDSIAEVITTKAGELIFVGSTSSWGLGGNISETDIWLGQIDQNGNLLWNRTLGTTCDEAGVSIIECSDGGFAIAASIHSWKNDSMDHYYYDGDVLLVRTDAEGTLLWNTTFGGPKPDWTERIVECSDGGLAIVGSTVNWAAGMFDILLIRFDANGNYLWNQTYGGEDFDHAWDIVRTESGFLIAGSSESFSSYTTVFNTTNPDGYLVCTDEEGNLLWNRTYGAWSDDGFYCIIPQPNNGYLITGYSAELQPTKAAMYAYPWLVRIDAVGNILWEKILRSSGHIAIGCSDGGFALAGSHTITEWWIHYDLSFVRLDNAGNVLWQWIHGYEELGDAVGTALQLEDTSFLLIAYSDTCWGDVWMLRISDIRTNQIRVSQSLIPILVAVMIIIIGVVIVLVWQYRRRRVLQS
ncbi:MAG: hypothetical protein ACFFCF_06695 [Promethearchaeota archaeon]